MNWIRGIVLHKKDNSEHQALIRYRGLTCIGYICSGCGYKWYEKRNFART